MIATLTDFDAADESTDEDEDEETCPNGDPDCDPFEDDVPCWPCYRDSEGKF